MRGSRWFSTSWTNRTRRFLNSKPPMNSCVNGISVLHGDFVIGHAVRTDLPVCVKVLTRVECFAKKARCVRRFQVFTRRARPCLEPSTAIYIWGCNDSWDFLSVAAYTRYDVLKAQLGAGSHRRPSWWGEGYSPAITESRQRLWVQACERLALRLFTLSYLGTDEANTGRGIHRSIVDSEIQKIWEHPVV